MESFRLSEDQRDTLTEILNIGIGNAAEVMSQMTSEPIEIAIPNLHVVIGDAPPEAFQNKTEVSLVKLGFSGFINGSAAMMLEKKDALKLASLLQQEELEEDVPEVEWSETVNEVGNIVVNSIMGSVANMFEEELHYTVPQYNKVELLEYFESCTNLSASSIALLAEIQFQIKKHELSAKVMVAFSVDSFHFLAKQLRALYQKFSA